METYKLSQAAPVLPTSQKERDEKLTYGVSSPVSASTIPSVYNKKLSKLFRGRLVVLPENLTVAQALRRMAKYNITSSPVIARDNSILGFVDMLDMLAFLCQLVGKDTVVENINIEELKAKTSAFKERKLSEVVAAVGKHAFHVMNGEESLSDAIQQYLKGVHRIAITDDCGDITGVVSQWTIANYLDTVPTGDKEWIPAWREKIGKHTYTKDVISINANKSTLEGFLLMYNKQLSALAVVDDQGTLCGNLSASDLKGFQLFLNDFGDLLQPTSEFLKTIRKQQGRPDNFAVFVRNLDTPIKDIVHRFNEDIVHRAYIVDDNSKPIGVFSLTDLMQDFISDTHTISTFAKTTAMPKTTTAM